MAALLLRPKTPKHTQVRNLAYPDRLKKLKICRMEERAKRGDLIETYKLLTGKIHCDPGQFFEIAEGHQTRGHHLKLKKKHSRLKLRSKFFSNRVVSTWNDLSEYIVSARTTDTFKARLDKHWPRLRHSLNSS